MTGTDAIAAAARALLVSRGVEAVTLRGVARELGVTAPALYRYVDSHQHLLVMLGAAVRREAVAAIGSARDAAGPDPIDSMRAACRTFREWSVEHPAEFGVAFGQPRGLPTRAVDPAASRTTPEDPVLVADDGQPAGVQFASVFAAVYAQMWSAYPIALVAPEPDGEFGAHLARYRGAVGLDDLPLGAVRQFLGSWVRIFGMVAVEVFGHITFALDDAEPLFESELTQMLGPERASADPSPSASP